MNCVIDTPLKVFWMSKVCYVYYIFPSHYCLILGLAASSFVPSALDGDLPLLDPSQLFLHTLLQPMMQLLVFFLLFLTATTLYLFPSIALTCFYCT